MVVSRLALLASTLYLCASFSGQAQPIPDADEPNPSHRVYVELLGNAGGGSVNYERDLAPGVAVRGGLGYMPGLPETTRNAVSAPLMLSLTPTGRRGVELGIGVVLRYHTEAFRESQPPQRRGLTDPFFTATVGYRRVTENGGVFRIGLTPLYGHADGNDEAWGIVPLVGLSFGGQLSR